MPPLQKKRGLTRNESLINVQQGTLSKEGEVLSYSLFDTITLAAATTFHDFYTVPLGQAGKTKADTNMVQAGVMPAGQRLRADFIKVMVVGDTAGMTDTELNAWFHVMFNTSVEIMVPGKENLGIWTLTELMGYSQAMAMAATQEGTVPRFSGIFRLQVPILLAAQTPFKVRMEHHSTLTDNTDGMKIKLALSGVLERLS